MTDLYKVLGVDKSADADAIKSAYRALAHKFHPDKNPGKSAAESFRQITEAYSILSDADKRKKYDEVGVVKPVTVSSRKNSYTLDGWKVPGEVAHIYRAGSYALKVCQAQANNDILENEARVSKLIFTAKKATVHHRYFNQVIDTFKLNNDGLRQVNASAWLGGWYNLQQVLAAYPSGVKFEHGIWMFNRMLEALDYLHNAVKTVHGALVPEHVMVFASDADHDPNNHGAKLIGLGAAVPIGQKVKIASPLRLHDFYAPEIPAKIAVDQTTDIYMAVKCLIYVLGGDPKQVIMPSTVPDYLQRFIKGCVFDNMRRRPQDAWSLHQELEELMAKYYGPKKYFKFTMPT